MLLYVLEASIYKLENQKLWKILEVFKLANRKLTYEESQFSVDT
jgi:hypothetical protein